MSPQLYFEMVSKITSALETFLALILIRNSQVNPGQQGAHMLALKGVLTQGYISRECLVRS